MKPSTLLTLSPIKETTEVLNDSHEWKPKDFSSFMDELSALISNTNEDCLFRGHYKKEWFIDSTFARRLKEEQGIKLIHRYPDDLINNISHQRNLAKKWIDKVDTIFISPYLQAYASQGIDPLYEYFKHLQQNPDDPNLQDISPYGSNFIDFTEDWRVGLFFANAERNEEDEGALFVIRQTALGKVLFRGKTPFQDTFEFLKSHLLEKPEEMYGILPLWIDPDFHLNNLLDPKPKRQKAVYLVQQDLRIDLGLSWELLWEKTKKQAYVKIILPKGTQKEVEKFLQEQGITEEYLFPKTIFKKTELK